MRLTPVRLAQAAHTVAPVLSRAFRLFRPREADPRRRFFDAAAPNTGHVSVEAEGLTFIVSTADEAPGARFFESHQPPVVRKRTAESRHAHAVGWADFRTECG